MADLVGWLIGWLLLATLAATAAGWFLHALINGRRLEAAVAERKARREALMRLQGPVEAVLEPRLESERILELENALMAERLRSDQTQSTIADLERQLAESRGRVMEAESLRLRIAELERGGAPSAPLELVPLTQRIGELEGEVATLRPRAQDADALQMRVGELQAALDAALAPKEADQAAKWRQRYLEARVRYLEGLSLEAPPAPIVDTSRVEALEQAMAAKEQDAVALRARIAELEAAPPLVAPDEPERLKWRARYLESRVTHLEGLMAIPQPPAIDPQEASRAKWRQRYFESRTAYLEGLQAAQGAERQTLAGEAAALTARADALGPLEADLAARSAAQAEAERARDAALAEAAALRAKLDDAEEAAARVSALEDQVLAAMASAEELEPYRARAETLEVEREALEKRLALTLDALEALKAQPPKVVVDETEVHRLRARIAEMEHEISALRAMPQPSVDESELTRLRWKSRYLDSRVQYLEMRLAAAQRAAPPPEPSFSQRTRERYEWRQVLVVDEPPPPPEPPPAPPVRDRYEWRQVIVEPEPEPPPPSRERYEWRQVRVADDPLPTVEPPPAPPPRPRYVWRAERPPEEFVERNVRPTARERVVWRQVLVSADDEPYVEPSMPEPGLEERPPMLKRPRGGAPDDLRMIAGVGPRIEATLHSLGIYHFDQIEAWTPAHIAWIEGYMHFRGRVRREGWVEQARALARGEMTDGKRRYLSGEHD